MKALFTYNFLLLLAFAFSTAYAKKVSGTNALHAGQNFLLTKGVNKSQSFKLDSISVNRNAVIYAITSDQAFILLSGDDRVTPVLGYSTEGTISLTKIPDNTRKWIEWYKSQILTSIAEDWVATEEIVAEWQELLRNSSSVQNKSLNNLNPLCQAKWNQDPYYNDMCPWDSRYNERAVVGCVATAMAIIMKYWGHPRTGIGSHSYNHSRYGTLSANFGNTTYNWASMPNSINGPNTEIARISYHLGVSVNMNYNVGREGGSGAYVTGSGRTSQTALVQNFGYKNSLSARFRRNFSDVNWNAMLKTELDLRRPILYVGYGSGGGHAFVCDGYDNSNRFHFNWGWGGSYDGYFLTNALNPAGLGTGGGSGGFNSSQEVIIGIEPPASAVNYSISLFAPVTPSATTIQAGGAFSVSTNFLNTGTTNFQGDYTAAVFQDNTFIDYIETKTNFSLQPNYRYNNDLVFSTTGIANMRSGTYQVYTYFKPSGTTNWQIVSDRNGMVNRATITVAPQVSNNLTMQAPLNISTGTTITRGGAITITWNVRNPSSGNYTGDIDLDIYKPDGSFVRTLRSYPGSTLCGGCSFTSNLTYSTTNFDLEVGSYKLTVTHRPSGGSWTDVSSSGSMANPLDIIVAAAAIAPDRFEENNSIVTAKPLSLTWTNNQARANTQGTNLHSGNDVDFFYIDLPIGYNYTMNPRLHDSYDAANGNTYTVDALFSYSTDYGANYSTTFDHTMINSLWVAGGNRLYFKIAQYYTGTSGTYLFDLPIQRSFPTQLGQNESLDQQIKLFPNPISAGTKARIEISAEGTETYRIVDMQGREHKMGRLTQGLNELETDHLDSGVYFVLLINSKGQVRNTKLIIQ